MANKHVLRYLPVAVDDLTAIFDWIANDSPANAAAFIEPHKTPDSCLVM
jgi:plasmid stabilization system protein ParE